VSDKLLPRWGIHVGRLHWVASKWRQNWGQDLNWPGVGMSRRALIWAKSTLTPILEVDRPVSEVTISNWLSEL